MVYFDTLFSATQCVISNSNVVSCLIVIVFENLFDKYCYSYYVYSVQCSEVECSYSTVAVQYKCPPGQPDPSPYQTGPLCTRQYDVKCKVQCEVKGEVRFAVQYAQCSGLCAAHCAVQSYSVHT